jgi:broad specificity phosphatase PhoE
MSIDLIFETHSLTTDNEAQIAIGWLPGELSPRGRDLARELGKRHRNSAVAAVFVSDLARAVETAEIAFGDRDVPIHRDARLRECDYGDLNGMPVSRLSGRLSEHIDTPFPGGQSYRDVVAQTRDFLRDITRPWGGHRLIVIAHTANKWALDHLLCSRPLEDLVDAPFGWQEGWHYTVRSGWTATCADGLDAPT